MRTSDAPSGITLTLEGPDGPSSVELSVDECVELSDAVLAAGDSTIGAAGDSTKRASLAGSGPLDRILLERFPAASAVGRWAAAAASRVDRDSARPAPATLPGADGEEFARTSAVMGSLAASLAVVAGGESSTAGRRLVRLVSLATEAHRLRSEFELAVVEARIESMKQLAYGAGHEINNPLANIATRAQSLLSGERDPERRRRLAAIIDQAFRARDMIGGLMLFARPPKPAREESTVQSIVAAAVAAVEAAALGQSVQIRVDAGRKMLVGHWDKSQLEEAVRAVLTNAIEASRGGGEVHVLVGVDPKESASCRLQVVDAGQGMDRETLAKAFDPFFSGREAGRGIGLGLSKVWRLVEINGGRTTIESSYGHGTTVSILLPMHAERDLPAGSTHPLQCDARALDRASCRPC